MVNTGSSDVFDHIRPHLLGVKNPVQYVGGEFNQVVKDPQQTRIHMAVALPDTYELGMSHLGRRILYGIANQLDYTWCERVFAPWFDMGDLLRERGLPLVTLESKTPLSELDVLGFTLQSELTYTNILYMLDLGGVPLLASERGEDDPIVICGGDGSTHPEPLADFVDVFFQGDGEDSILAFLDSLDELKRGGASREQRLLEIARRHDFCYVPRFFEPRYANDSEDGAYLGLVPTAERLHMPMRSARVFDFENTFFPTKPVVSNGKAVHDRITLESMRGCTRGCRFCQAGMLRRPVRTRSPEKLVELALETFRNTGYDEVSLQSLSSGDYPAINELMDLCDASFSEHHVGLALPSLRVTQQLALLPGRMKSVRKSGLTMAPEVATDHLRRIISKEILNKDLYATASAAFANGWDLVKLYFMIGNPGETAEDVLAIWDMANQVSRQRKVVTGKANARVNVTVSTFVPKPFTPFQWARMLEIDEIRERQDMLRDAARNKRVMFKFHRAESSTLEGILCRGDRRTGKLLLAAYRRGARFDAWDEGFNWDVWQAAFEEAGVDPTAVVNRTLDPAAPLPWDHLSPGVAKKFLLREWERSGRAEPSSDCFGPRCHACGVEAKLCFHYKRGFSLPKDKPGASMHHLGERLMNKDWKYRPQPSNGRKPAPSAIAESS